MDSQDVVNRLRGIINREQVFDVDWDYPFSVDTSYMKLNCEGFSIVIFVDVGELDHVDRVELSDGTVIEFMVDENDPIAQLSEDECQKLLALYKARSSVFTKRWYFRAHQGWKRSWHRLKRWKANMHRKRVEPPPVCPPSIHLAPSCPVEQLAFLPGGNSLRVFRVNGTVIESLAEIPYKQGDPWKLATPFVGDVPGWPGKVMAVPFVRRPGTAGWLAGVTSDFTRVSVMRIDSASQDLRPQLLFTAPDGCEIHSCAIDGSNLYIGGTPAGKSTSPSLWSVNLEKEARWRRLRVWFARGWRFLGRHSALDPFQRKLTERHRVKLEPPTNYCPGDRKSVDDVLIDTHRGRLIAVDDLVFPKYLFEFSLAPSQPLKQVRSVEIDSFETYSSIVKGVLAERYLVLMSCHSGWANRDRRGLSFLDSVRLVELASIHLPSDACQDIAITSDCLFLAGGDHGLGILRFDGPEDLDGGQPHPLILRNDAPSSRTPLAIDLATRLRYTPVDHAGALMSVEPQDEPGFLLSIFKDGGKLIPATLRYDQEAEEARVEKTLQ